MHGLAIIVGITLILIALVDSFETIIQPRRVVHRFRYARLYYRQTWRVWRVGAHFARAQRLRESLLSAYGPLSVLGLFATWVFWLILGFAVLDWGIHTPLAGNVHGSFPDYLYLSGTTFFTLGFGDVTPNGPFGRALAVFESGMGFGFLAVIVSYLPVLYQAFSAREVVISQMDARAGSPPTAGELLLRLARAHRIDKMDDLMALWERWTAELLESQLSFPVLSYYRSQHDNQSWLAVLTMILDTCAILLTQVKVADLYQVQITFATARHAAVDLALVLKAPPLKPSNDRLAPTELAYLQQMLRDEGVTIRPSEEARLAELRAMYEPFLESLAQRLLFNLPPIVQHGKVIDNWQRSSLGRAPAIGELAPEDEHF